MPNPRQKEESTPACLLLVGEVAKVIVIACNIHANIQVTMILFLILSFLDISPK